MPLINYIISALGFGFLLVALGFLGVFLWQTYRTLFSDLLLRFTWFRKRKYNQWADIVFNCLANDWGDEAIIKLLSSNGMQEEDINQIFNAVNARIKKSERGVK